MARQFVDDFVGGDAGGYFVPAPAPYTAPVVVPYTPSAAGVATPQFTPWFDQSKVAGALDAQRAAVGAQADGRTILDGQWLLSVLKPIVAPPFIAANSWLQSFGDSGDVQTVSSDAYFLSSNGTKLAPVDGASYGLGAGTYFTDTYDNPGGYSSKDQAAVVYRVDGNIATPVKAGNAYRPGWWTDWGRLAAELIGTVLTAGAVGAYAGAGAGAAEAGAAVAADAGAGAVVDAGAGALTIDSAAAGGFGSGPGHRRLRRRSRQHARHQRRTGDLRQSRRVGHRGRDRGRPDVRRAGHRYRLVARVDRAASGLDGRRRAAELDVCSCSARSSSAHCTRTGCGRRRGGCRRLDAAERGFDPVGHRQRGRLGRFGRRRGRRCREPRRRRQGRAGLELGHRDRRAARRGRALAHLAPDPCRRCRRLPRFEKVSHP